MWDTITDRLSGAYKQAEKHLSDDLARIKNLPGVLSYLKDLSGQDLLLLLDQARKIKRRKNPRFPEIDGDFYDTFDILSEQEKSIVESVRTFMAKHVAPIANRQWMKAEFPFQIIPPLKDLDVAALTVPKAYGGRGLSSVLEGIVTQEIARVDVSTCTFFGVHSGLATQSILQCGSTSQKEEWLPQLAKMDKIGAFALTEPEVGSAISLGMETRCEREGDTWTITGQKKWIGNATFSDFIIIWAKDVDDHQVKGFIVDRETKGLTTEVIEDKMALRTVQNALIHLQSVQVPESRRLQNAESFKDTAQVLKATRAGVAWQAVGCARGLYERTLRYTMDRRQFGRPIAGFQLTQDLLSNMLAQLTAMQTMVLRLSELQDLGVMNDEQAALAKVFCTTGNRSIGAMARELMGGNGILISNDVARFLGDAEALYSYEGTKQINSLVVGRAITGQSAFV